MCNEHEVFSILEASGPRYFPRLFGIQPVYTLCPLFLFPHYVPSPSVFRHSATTRHAMLIVCQTVYTQKKKVKKKEKTRLTYIRPRLIVQRTNVRFARVSDFSIACYTIQVNDHWEERIILVVCFFILGISRDRRRIILLRFRNSILFSSFNLLTKL